MSKLDKNTKNQGKGKYYNADNEIEFVSKTEIKNEMLELQSLGEKLTEMTLKKVKTIPMSDTLMAAMEEMQRIKKNEAKRRHLQYIGKVMRSEDIEAIKKALDLLDSSSETYIRIQNQCELWRNRLVKDNNAMNEYIGHHPEIDRQQFRNLVRNAQKEVAAEKPATNYKKLFQLLREYE